MNGCSREGGELQSPTCRRTCPQCAAERRQGRARRAGARPPGRASSTPIDRSWLQRTQEYREKAVDLKIRRSFNLECTFTTWMTYIKLYRREVNAGRGDGWLFSMPLSNLCSRKPQGHWQHGWLEPEAAAATQKGSHRTLGGHSELSGLWTWPPHTLRPQKKRSGLAWNSPLSWDSEGIHGSESLDAWDQ